MQNGVLKREKKREIARSAPWNRYIRESESEQLDFYRGLSFELAKELMAYKEDAKPSSGSIVFFYMRLTLFTIGAGIVSFLVIKWLFL